MVDQIKKSELTQQLTVGSELFKYVFDTREKEKNAVLNPTDITIETYSEMLNDAGILYPLWIIKLPIVRNRWHYENPDPDIEKFVRMNLSRIWAKMIPAALTSFEYGFAAFEKRFEVIDGKYWYKTPVDLMPAFLKLLISNDGSYAGLVQSFPGRAEVKLDVWKTLVVTHDKRFGNHYGRSRLRSAYRYWAIDKSAYNFHAIAMQNFAVPTVLGRSPAGQSTTGYDEKGNPISRWNLDIIQEIAESIHSKSAVSFPSEEGWNLDLLSDKRTVYWEFNKDHEFFDRMKAKAIFVPEEIVQGKGGSYAKTEVQSRWLEEMIEAIQEDLVNEYLMPYLIEPLITINFFNGKTKPPAGRLFFSPLAERDRAFLQNMFLKAYLEEKPFQIDFDELARVFSIPIKVSKEKTERETMIGQIAKNLKEHNKISELDRKNIVIELRRAYNLGIEKIKSQTDYVGYVNFPANDITFIEQEARGLIERIKGLPSITNLEAISESFFSASKFFCRKLGEDAAETAIKRLVK